MENVSSKIAGFTTEEPILESTFGIAIPTELVNGISTPYKVVRSNAEPLSKFSLGKSQKGNVVLEFKGTKAYAGIVSSSLKPENDDEKKSRCIALVTELNKAGRLQVDLIQFPGEAPVYQLRKTAEIEELLAL